MIEFCGSAIRSLSMESQFIVHIRPARNQIWDTLVLIKGAPPDVTFLLGSALGAIDTKSLPHRPHEVTSPHLPITARP